MSRKVKLQVLENVEVRDVDLKVLDALDVRAEGPGAWVKVSKRELAAELQASDATVHRALLSCSQRGFICIRPELQSNGGRDANAYALTSTGLTVLSAARRAGIVGERA